MKKKNYSETQIVSILKQYEGCREAMDVCHEYGISKATLFNWRKRYNGLEATQLKELRALQDENRRLEQMYAELSLDYKLAKDIIEKSCGALSAKGARGVGC